MESSTRTLRKCIKSGLVGLDPFRDQLTFRAAMDRSFDQTVDQPAPAFTALGSAAIDLYQTAGDAVVKASLPGIGAKDLHRSVTGDVLRLRGEVREEEDVEGAQPLIKEHRYGAVARSISMPTSVVTGRADARFGNGTLPLTLPKVEAVKHKTPAVRADEREPLAHMHSLPGARTPLRRAPPGFLVDLRPLD
jgi:HSP20 family protein